jgi:hypothetical protein
MALGIWWVSGAKSKSQGVALLVSARVAAAAELNKML